MKTLKSIIEERGQDFLTTVKPCSCCGSYAYIDIYSDMEPAYEMAAIVCSKKSCGIRTRKKYFSSAYTDDVTNHILDELIEVWNRRV